jgi:hypothetical protein
MKYGYDEWQMRQASERKHNAQTCGLGPRRCLDCRAILSESHEQRCARIAREDAELGRLRTAGEFRAGIRYDEEDTTMTTLDPYQAGIERLRTAQGITIDNITDNDPRLRAMQERRAAFYEHVSTSRRAARQPATSRAHLQPPDPYAEALKAMKEDR